MPCYVYPKGGGRGDLCTRPFPSLWNEKINLSGASSGSGGSWNVRGSLETSDPEVAPEPQKLSVTIGLQDPASSTSQCGRPIAIRPPLDAVLLQSFIAVEQLHETHSETVFIVCGNCNTLQLVGMAASFTYYCQPSR